ncbi:MAG: mycothiol synthase [Acidimicrobiia bacterium]
MAVSQQSWRVVSVRFATYTTAAPPAASAREPRIPASSERPMVAGWAGTLDEMLEARVLERFAPADVAAVRSLAASVEAASGTAPFGDLTWSGLEGRGTLGDRGILLPGDDGAAAAYVHLAHHQPAGWSAELAALPGQERALGALLASAIDVVAREGGGHVTIWLHGDHHDDLPRTAGFALERELLELRVPLPLPEDPEWPDGVKVRTFVVGQDEVEWLGVNNRAFANHPEQGGWTLDTLHQRERAGWFDPNGFLLAFDDDGLAGFCWTKVHPTDPPKEPVALGEIYVIGTEPGRQGRGLGRALTIGGLASLAGRGITMGMLYVDGDNTAAVALYRSLAFVTHRVDRAYGRTVTSAAS